MREVESPELLRLADDPRVETARQHIRGTDGLTLANLVELAEIPSPPFGERQRAERVRELLHEAALTEVAVDAEGNVIALQPASGGEALEPFILSAHLDTVFPAEVDTRVRRANGRLIGPGVSDNARGLASLVAIARALNATGVPLQRPVLFAATVGEEGIGNLRGVRHLFEQGAAAQGAAGFISLDGAGRRQIVNRALGSRRLRAIVRGPGGHSWADWGAPNPIHRLSAAVAEISGLLLPRQPRTAVTVSRIGGGTSVNTIPSEAWIEVDLRSESLSALAETERRVRDCLTEEMAHPGSLHLTIEVIGDRPVGETAANQPLVRAAQEATRLLGEVPELISSSTDANVPIALGIPAIAMGAGGVSGNTHTTQEWYANDGGPEGIERVLLTLLRAVGLGED